ncbi:DUF6377 domain-containing protein [Flavobacterium rhizosphaerae]|uniref:DUF6377 domain-containing protein n=1 Tax=Flavobacterium rhizosphaerae TaxID=3163298 RepID=A0ABW8YYP1_9FLAO
MKKVILFIILLFSCPLFASETDSLLLVLEKEMAKSTLYESAKKTRITQLKNFLTDITVTDAERYNINEKLIEEYLPYKFDATLYYINKNIALAQKLNNTLLLFNARMHLAYVLSSSGNYTEAQDIMQHINPEKLFGTLKTRYYYVQMWLYYRLGFYSPENTLKTQYTTLYTAYADTLLLLAKPNSELYLSTIEIRHRDAGKYAKNRNDNLKRLAMATPGTRTYSSITFFLAQSYLPENNIKAYKKYLILSALSDIKASIKDNASLTALAVQLFKENDIKRAHRYINVAFDDASFFNSRLRLASLSNILPIINKAYEQDIQHQKEKLQVYLIIISLLTLLLLFTIFFIRKQVKKLSAARKNLQQANNRLNDLNTQLLHTNTELKGLYSELSEINRIKEYYIGTLLNVCSDYLDKLDGYRKTVKKMILAKQIDELLKRTKSGQIIDEEINLFYKNFDAIFLHIYPHFVEQLNSLLVPEEKIVLKKDELLTTELRIFALIRLGITDSGKIAKLLRYSVNTIYNYRVKVKNKAAVPRDEFENLVMKIGSFADTPNHK